MLTLLPLTRMTTTLDHVGFTVSDLDRSLPFYRDLLGMEVLWERACLCRRLRAAGVGFVSEPVVSTAGHYQGTKTVYVQGPDGISVQLFELS
jgi:catechol 2,3-dioxygenase-like lactoylglutathione lyase family enzyme